MGKEWYDNNCSRMKHEQEELEKIINFLAAMSKAIWNFLKNWLLYHLIRCIHSNFQFKIHRTRNSRTANLNFKEGPLNSRRFQGLWEPCIIKGTATSNSIRHTSRKGHFHKKEKPRTSVKVTATSKSKRHLSLKVHFCHFMGTGTSFTENWKIQKNWCTVTVAPTIEYHGGHPRTPANQRWDQVPGRSQRLLLG